MKIEVSCETFVEDFRLENFFITKYNIHNYSADGGWLYDFKEAIKDLEFPKFGLICEIGSFEAFTAKYMCENMLNDREDSRVICIDPLLPYYTEETKGVYPDFIDVYQRFMRNTRGLPIELHRDLSENVLPQLNQLRFDFTFIDGNHYAPHPYNDAVWVFAETIIGGYILFDDFDIWSTETKESIDKFINEFNESLEIIYKGYKLLIKKTKDQFNHITLPYYS